MYEIYFTYKMTQQSTQSTQSTLTEMFNEVFNYEETREMILKHKKAILDEEYEKYVTENFDNIYSSSREKSIYLDTGGDEYRITFARDGSQQRIYKVEENGDETLIKYKMLIILNYEGDEYIRLVDDEYLLRDNEEVLTYDIYYNT